MARELRIGIRGACSCPACATSPRVTAKGFAPNPQDIADAFKTPPPAPKSPWPTSSPAGAVAEPESLQDFLKRSK